MAKRSPEGKRSCRGSGVPVGIGFRGQAPGATIKRICPECGQQIRVIRPNALKGSGKMAKHTRPLTEEEIVERKAKTRVVALAPRQRPSGLV